MSSNRSSIRVSILGFLMIALTCLTIVAGTTWSANLFADRGDFAVSAARTTGNEILIPLFAPDDDKTTALRAAGIAASGRIAFSSDRILGIQKIFTIGGDGVGLTCLMCPGSSDASGTGTADTSTGTTPAVSPDGKTIAFVRSGQIWLMNTDGSGQPANTNVTGSNPQWSPDGTKLVFHRNINASGAPNNEIFVVNRNGTGEVNITNNAGNDVFPSWGAPVANHPEGRISFRSSRTGDSEIFVISPLTPNAPITNVTNNPAFDSSAKWSPDGTKLVFYSYRDAPNGEIYTLNPDTAAVARLTNDSLADSFPAWSPDGIKIVFMRHTTSTQAGNYELFTVDPIPANPLIPPGNLTNHPSADLDPSWGAVTTVSNGKIAFEAFSSGAGVTQIYTIADEVGATPALCGAGETREGHRPAYSHDGTKLAFMRGGTIWVANADCSSQVSTGAAGDAPTWSPLGDKIAFVRGSPFSDVWTMNIDGSSQTRRTNSAAQTNPAGSFSNGQPSWGSNDKIVFRGLSSKLVGGVSQSVGDIWTMEPAGSSFVKLTDDPVNAYAPDWSPDATKIVFISNRATNRGELYIMNSAGAGQTRITNDASISNGNPAWSPDGTKIVHDDDFSRITRRDSLGTNGAVLTTGTFPDWQATSSSSTAQADVRITSIGDTPDPAVIGQTVYYQTQLFNAGPSPATGVKLTTDPLPTGVDYSNQSPAYCVFGANRVVTCTLPNGLGTNGLDNSLRVDIAVTVRQPDTINFKARVTANEQDPTLANNEATATTSVLSSSDLALDVTGPTQATVDTNVTYSMVVTNNGPDSALGARAEFNMPTGVDFVSAEPASFNCTSTDISGGKKVTCTLGTVTGTVIPRITVKPHNIGPLTVGGQVFVTGSRDTVPGNDADSQNTTIVDIPRADLAISVQYSPNVANNTVRVGDNYSVYFTVSNSGPSPATNATIIFTTAAGVENIPALTDPRCNTAVNGAGETLYVCSLGTIANGASVNQLGITLRALATGTRTDAASVTANEPDPTGSNCIANPSSNNCVTTGGQINAGQVDLELLAFQPPYFTFGENSSYTVTVRNNGPSRATNVRLQNVINSANADVVSVVGPGCSGTALACNIGEIPAGTNSGVVVVTLTPRNGSSISFTSSASGSQPEPGTDPHPNSVTFATPIRPRIDLIGLEVTQAVQDLANSVPLVADKRTFVRAYVRTPAGLPERTITASIVGTNSGGVTNGSLAPSNPGQTVMALLDPKRKTLIDSFYFELPPDWIKEGTLQFRIESSDATLLCQEPDGVPNCAATVQFQARRKFSIKFVMTTFIDAAGNSFAPTNADLFQAMTEIRANFPMADFSTAFQNTWTTRQEYCTTAGVSNILASLKTMRGKDCGPSLPLTAKCRPDIEDYHFVVLPEPFANGLCLLGGIAATGMADTQLDGKTPTNTPQTGDGIKSDNSGNTAIAVAGHANTRTHELGHAFGLRHTSYVGSGVQAVGGPDLPSITGDGTISPNNKLDYDQSTYFGFDTLREKITDLAPLAGSTNAYATHTRVYDATTPDMMSYGPAAWISAYKYQRLFNALAPLSGRTEQDEPDTGMRVAANEMLAIDGTISFADGTGRIGNVQTLSAPGSVILPLPGEYSIRLENTLGNPLASYSFEVSQFSEGDAGSFVLFLPKDPATRRLVLLHNGQVLATRIASAAPPTMTLTSPNGGETLSGPTANVTWTASDPDNDSLTYAIDYSKDGGFTWTPLSPNWDTTTYPVNVTKLPASTQGLFRVTASDGFNSAQDQSNAVFTVSPHAPEAVISAPANNQKYVADQMVNLSGTSLDVEEGILADSRLSWSSNLSGPLGTGSHLAVNALTLQEGTHTITLTATDGTSLTGTASVSIKVYRTRPTFPAELSVGPTGLTFDTSFGSGAIAPQSLAIRNAGDGELAWTATADQPWIQLASAAGTSPANADMNIDQTNLPPGNYHGTITITAAGAVNSPQTVSVDLTIIAGPPSTIGGRVLTPTGLGIRNATVSLVNSQGVSRTATTSSFGVFSFADVPDDYYTIRVSSKRYRFAARSVQIFNDFTLTDFVGLE